MCWWVTESVQVCQGLPAGHALLGHATDRGTHRYKGNVSSIQLMRSGRNLQALLPKVQLFGRDESVHRDVIFLLAVKTSEVPAARDCASVEGDHA